jgi:hypothetical protein
MKLWHTHCRVNGYVNNEIYDTFLGKRRSDSVFVEAADYGLARNLLYNDEWSFVPNATLASQMKHGKAGEGMWFFDIQEMRYLWGRRST